MCPKCLGFLCSCWSLITFMLFLPWWTFSVCYTCGHWKSSTQRRSFFYGETMNVDIWQNISPSNKNVSSSFVFSYFYMLHLSFYRLTPLYISVVFLLPQAPSILFVEVTVQLCKIAIIIFSIDSFADYFLDELIPLV